MIARRADGERKTVLVVEDDPDAREIYVATLGYAGFDVVAADSIAQANAAVAKKKPDVVVLDCRLPDGSGIDLLRRWKASGPLMRTPVVVVTAFSESEHVDGARRAGADAFMVKPCPGDALAAFLARLLVSSAPTQRVPKYESVAFDGPPIVFPYGRTSTAATLHFIDTNQFQARCEPCLRPSPVLVGSIESAMRRATDLGWKHDASGAWTCPVCQERARTGLRRRPT
jgi:DNA-binding response OmpR family regulator